MRETRSYGSARGVRSNPYPYRDNSSPAAKQRDSPTDQTPVPRASALRNRHRLSRKPAEFVQELDWGRWLIALTASAR
jgi:hypothetical protein